METVAKVINDMIDKCSTERRRFTPPRDQYEHRQYVYYTAQITVLKDALRNLQLIYKKSLD